MINSIRTSIEFVISTASKQDREREISLNKSWKIVRKHKGDINQVEEKISIQQMMNKDQRCDNPD